MMKDLEKIGEFILSDGATYCLAGAAVALCVLIVARIILG